MKSMARLVCVVCFVFVSLAQATTIHMIGDSTMADKRDPETHPEVGWGQVLQDNFDANQVVVRNYALNGHRSKSFMDEGHWSKIMAALQPDDYVFIQFGYNDQKDKSPDRYTNPFTGYRANLTKYVQESRSKGAMPVLRTQGVTG